MFTLKDLFLASHGVRPRPAATWSDFEQLLIEATIAFANMQGVQEAEDVDTLFDPFAQEMWVLARPSKAARLLEGVQARRAATLLGGPFIHPRSKDTYRRQKIELRQALSSFVDKGNIEKALQNRLDQRLKEVPFQLGLVEGRLVYRFSVESVAVGWALGIVALLDNDYPVRQCDQCSRYFVIFNAKERRRRYCADCAESVRRETAAARQRRWRQKKQRKR